MKKVAIVTDSICCLPRELVDQYGLFVVPLQIVYEGKTYKDGVDIQPGDVYSIMRRRNSLPTTSTPSIGGFLDAFRTVSEQAKAVLCITVTSLQSKVYETAIIASDMIKESNPAAVIEVLDSRSVAGALGFIVLEAARAADRGAELEHVVSVAKSVMAKVRFVATLDTLYYLARSGRLARAAAWAGALLNIKPVLGHEPAIGETMPVARPRTREKAISTMLKIMEETVDKAPVHVMVHHAGELEAGRRLLDEVVSRFNCVEHYLTEFTPGMGVHTGPGLLGIAFYAD